MRVFVTRSPTKMSATDASKSGDSRGKYRFVSDSHNSIDCRWADAEAKGIAPRTISVQLRSNFEHTSPFTPASGLVRFLHLCIDDHGSLVIFRSASVRPKHLIDP